MIVELEFRVRVVVAKVKVSFVSNVVTPVALKVVAPERVRVAPVVRVPREVALIAVAELALIVVAVRLVVNAFKLSTDPAPPLLGDIFMFPVVDPPRVRV